MTAPQESTTPPLPNGWFAIAWSKDLVAGDVKRIQYFGEELVLFRTREGVPKVLDAYCAHLGAHLAEGGRVVGETIRCPFHAWHYDGDGNCVKIPYCKRIPAAAKLRSWEVVERNHMIMVWRHAENKPPSWDVPAMPEFEDHEWTEVRTFELTVAVHMQDMAENNCDPVHFYYVHSATDESPASEMTYGEGGRFFRITSKSEKETPYGTFEMELERDTWGLGLSSVRMKGIGEAGLLMFSSTTPIDEGHSHSRWAFSVTKDLADVAGEEFIEGMSTGVLQDMRIWENKIHRANPVLCEADEYLAEFRRWTRQFYSDVD
jgi:phenylpropionate dioxygenase-like ring-hydroxylating dioxygenase large terminal subunit